MRNMKKGLLLGLALISAQSFAITATTATMATSAALNELSPAVQDPNAWTLPIYQNRLLNVMSDKDVLRIALVQGFGACKLLPLQVGNIKTYRLVTAQVSGVKGKGLYAVELKPQTATPAVHYAHGIVKAAGLLPPANEARFFQNYPADVLGDNAEANAVKMFKKAILASRCGTATLPVLNSVNYTSMDVNTLKSSFEFFAKPKGILHCRTTLGGPKVYIPSKCKYEIKPIAVKPAKCKEVYKRIAVQSRPTLSSTGTVSGGTLASTNPLTQPAPSLPVINVLTPAIEAELSASLLPHKTLVEASLAAQLPSALESFPLIHMLPDLAAAEAGNAQAIEATAKFIKFSEAVPAIGFDSADRYDFVSIGNMFKTKPYMAAALPLAATYVQNNPPIALSAIQAVKNELVKPIRPWTGLVNVSQFACPMQMVEQQAAQL